MSAVDEVGVSYPATGLNVHGPSERTLAAFKNSGALVYAEIGVYEGETTLAIARHLNGRGAIHIFDFADKVEAVADRLRRAGHTNVVCHPNSRKILDSYNWSLMRLLEQSEPPAFDYVYLDGAHTWVTDALAFLLVDRLLRPGGFIEFDDYYWTIGRSPSMNPEVFPAARRLYTDEQMDARQVALVIDLLVRTDSRYEEVEEHRLFRKRDDS